VSFYGEKKNFFFFFPDKLEVLIILNKIPTWHGKIHIVINHLNKIPTWHGKIHIVINHLNKFFTWSCYSL